MFCLENRFELLAVDRLLRAIAKISQMGSLLDFFLVGAKIRLLHEVGQALLRISFLPKNLAPFYYHFRGGWWREIVSASQRIRAVNGTSPLWGAFRRLYFFWDIGLGDLSVRRLLSCI